MKNSKNNFLQKDNCIKQLGNRAIAGILLLLLFASCKEHKHISQKNVVVQPAEIKVVASDLIQNTLADALDSNGHLKNFELNYSSVLQQVYRQRSYEPMWSNKDAFTPHTDSLFHFINNAYAYGLFPEDYNLERLTELRTQVTDTTKENKLDASKWAEADLRLTAAFVGIIKDLKWGRLLHDSLVKKDSLFNSNFFYSQWQAFNQHKNMAVIADSVEPQHHFYQEIKSTLQQFLDSVTIKKYATVKAKDSLQYPKVVAARLYEEDTAFAVNSTDSVALSTAIKKYQRSKKLKPDGKITPALIKELNQTPYHKFIRVAINMDRYKQLPSLPDQFIFVNIPAYRLQLWDSGMVMLTSKVIVGKPETRTPQITSAITNMITYPKWHIPESIIKKEILPGLKSDPGYLARKGFHLVDDRGNDVDPYTVKWAQYKSYIPYTVVQGSGDDNALGVFKFNFPNPYSVYLHDTNQRYLFEKGKRALSHGCVRVQAWSELASYILTNDSKVSTNAVPVDSMQNWLVLKEKHTIPVRKKVPLYIRYITCSVQEGNFVFYEDIYGEDSRLQDLFFSNK